MTTEIQDSRGPLHTGAGNQWNFLFHAATEVRRATRRGAGAWSEVAFEDVAMQFQPPDGFSKIEDAIEEQGIVVLRGEPGSGRRFAALKLLAKSEYSPGLFYAPVIDSADEESLAQLPLQTGDRVLLDLSTMSVERFTALVASELPAFFRSVRDIGARSVVILPDGCEPAAEWMKLVRPIARPNPVQAYKNHLVSIGIKPVEGVDKASIYKHFAHAPMRDLDRLRMLVDEAREANPTLDYHEWTRKALEALSAGPEEVAAILKDLRAGHQRALLLSASLFAGLSADRAWHAAMILLDTLCYPKDPDLPLDRADLQEQLALFGASIDQNRRVQFKKPLDEAIRTYLWDGYPALRASLAKWIEVLAKGRGDPDPDSEQVVTRFGHQHLRTGQVDSLKQLIASLAGLKKDTVNQSASILLALGLTDPVHGRYFRLAMNDWARETSLSTGLGAVLIDACARTLVHTYPDQALVRLHNLARHPGPVGEMACEALAQQLDDGRLGRLLVLLLRRMADVPHKRDPYVFCRVVDPDRLTAAYGRYRPLATNHAVRAYLTRAWRDTLTALPEGWQERLHGWLGTTDATRRDLLLTVLAEAPADLTSRSRLHAAATGWAVASGASWDVADDLLKRINAAQGISFVAMERTD